jgi:hypothetical protein
MGVPIENHIAKQLAGDRKRGDGLGQERRQVMAADLCHNTSLRHAVLINLLFKLLPCT